MSLNRSPTSEKDRQTDRGRVTESKTKRNKVRYNSTIATQVITRRLLEGGNPVSDFCAPNTGVTGVHKTCGTMFLCTSTSTGGPRFTGLLWGKVNRGARYIGVQSSVCRMPHVPAEKRIKVADTLRLFFHFFNILNLTLGLIICGVGVSLIASPLPLDISEQGMLGIHGCYRVQDTGLKIYALVVFVALILEVFLGTLTLIKRVDIESAIDTAVEKFRMNSLNESAVALNDTEIEKIRLKLIRNCSYARLKRGQKRPPCPLTKKFDYRWEDKPITETVCQANTLITVLAREWQKCIIKWYTVHCSNRRKILTIHNIHTFKITKRSVVYTVYTLSKQFTPWFNLEQDFPHHFGGTIIVPCLLSERDL
eukprot:sb/3465894/